MFLIQTHIRGHSDISINSSFIELFSSVQVQSWIDDGAFYLFLGNVISLAKKGVASIQEEIL